MSSGWTAKRFWKEAGVSELEGGFGVHLDGKPVKTPAKAPLVVPTRAMAEAIAAEWDAQEGKINPASMPVTRAANSAIDKVRRQRAEVAALIAAYGETDLLCYRAEKPAALIARQAEGWDALLDWAHATHGARLHVTQGVLPIAQPEPSVAALAAQVEALDEWELAALHDLVSITGSLVLGLAVVQGRLDAAAAWDLSRIDEDWQIAEWGDDEEARELALLKKEALFAAARFWALRHSGVN